MTNQKLMMTSMILTGLILTITLFAFAEQVSVSLPQGSGAPGCDETNECYLPYMVTVNPGDEVVWSNDYSHLHNSAGVVQCHHRRGMVCTWKYN